MRTDACVAVGARRWFANCVWDGLAIVALLGGTRASLDALAGDWRARSCSTWSDGVVQGYGIAHFLVPAARFWDDIGFT